MRLAGCVPIIPSADLTRSLRFWEDGLGFTRDREMRRDGRLVGCMLHQGEMHFWLNERAGPVVPPEEYEGIRLYWAPPDLHDLHRHLTALGYAVSPIVDRDYGQAEFFVTDDDGYSHCFGVPSQRSD